jgi:hypothetical protein
MKGELTMGWLKHKCTRLGVGLVETYTAVAEPAGYAGETIHPAGSRLGILRMGRRIVARRGPDKIIRPWKKET